jgi:hypothetical protein
MGWEHDDVGDFKDEKDALDWAKRNDIDVRDMHISARGQSVRAAVRRSAVDRRNTDYSYGRDDG